MFLIFAFFSLWFHEFSKDGVSLPVGSNNNEGKQILKLNFKYLKCLFIGSVLKKVQLIFGRAKT